MTDGGKKAIWTPSRRALLGAGAAGAAALALQRLARGEGTKPPPTCGPAPTGAPALPLASLGAGPDRARFGAWLRARGVATDRAVRNLVYNFYDVPKAEPSWLYPMLAGKTMLWLVEGGEVDEAVAIADTVVRWQQQDRADKGALSYGAFPSMIEPGEVPGTYVQGSRYYAGDNLVLLEALLSVHARAPTPAYLNAAVGIGTWLVDVMCAGHRHGVWVEDHGAPMAFVTRTGDFGNAIQTAVELLWIGALGRLGRAVREPAYCRQADKAMRFYLQAQATSGALMDNYAPGWPPTPYAPGQWQQFDGGKLIADNVLRGALGLCRAGELGRARRVFDWLKVDDNGGIPAALDLTTGAALFPPGQEVYYDISSTALHRSLAQWLGERAAATRAVALLRQTQVAADAGDPLAAGAWYWGRLREQRVPVTPQIAPIVGLWATADLSRPEI